MANIDYRALLVRYMAMVLDCEGVSFVHSGDEIAMTEAETVELEKIESEASALVRGDRPPVIMAPRHRVFLDGVEQLGVLAFGEDDGLKWVDLQDDEAIVSQPEIPTVRVCNQNFEFKEV